MDPEQIRKMQEARKDADTSKEGRIKRYREKAKTSRAYAIYLFCWECHGYVASEARKCGNKNCPLWKYRCKNPDLGDEGDES